MIRAILPVLMLLACNSDKDTDPVDDTDVSLDDTDEQPPGPTTPTVSFSPSDGQRGVRFDTPLVLSFSEPMNTASVEAAWTSSSIAAGDVNFAWNGDGTVLTIDARASLDYAQGGMDVAAHSFDIGLDGTAQDAEGDVLAAASVTFWTARDITDMLPVVAARTGSFNGTVTTPVLRVGDDAANASWRAWLSFDLSALPADIVSLESATVSADQVSTQGDPFGDLGDVYPVALPGIPSLDDQVSYAAAGDRGPLLSDDAGDGVRTSNLRAALEAAVDGGATELAVRLELETAYDLEGDDDYVVYEAPALIVRLLAE